MSHNSTHSAITVPLQRLGPLHGAAVERGALTNFSRSGTCLSTLRRPEDDQDWESLFALPGPGGVTVRGGGASYSDAALNDGGTVAFTAESARIRGWDQERGVLEVDGGLTFGQVLSFCVPLGWTLPVVPGTAQASLGGALAADVHGKNHRTAGSFSSLVTAIVVITPGQGVLTVGPDMQPEIFWATVGGLGLTGVVQRLQLQLIPISSSWLTTTDIRCADLHDVLAVMTDQGKKKNAHERAHEHTVAWIDGHATKGSLGRGVVSIADHVAGPDLPPRLQARPLTYQSRQFTIGVPAGVNVVRPGLIRAANSARFARAKHGNTPKLKDFTHTFHPLDAVANWPVAYGRQGLIQYQFSVPPGQEQVLTTALQLLNAAECPPALVTLKRLGTGSLAPLSFPAPGWTMALDLPAGAAAAAAETLDRLDDVVTTAGGRVYLVKDSRLQPHWLPAMYPLLDQWREVRSRLDPTGIMTSDLDRRLDLTGRHASGRPC